MPFISPELAGSVAVQVDHDERVVSVVVARSTSIDSRQALITVAVGGASGATRHLTVPVARDNSGGLVVDELPSFAAAPRRASLPPATLDPVSGPEQGELRDVVSRFRRTYLAGDAAGLAYLVPAGVRLATPVPRGYELVDLDSLAHLSAQAPRELQLRAIARVRDLRSGAVLEQGYRLRLERRDRWHVADINGSREG